MIVKPPQLRRALAGPSEARLFLLYGPEESASRALVAVVAAAVGENAERIDFSAAEIRSDPARLADEAAAFSMFGGARYIVVDRAGDDILEAVEAVLRAPATGNPVVLLAGDLKKTSKLVKLVTAEPGAIGCASYPVEEKNAAALVAELGRPLGLSASSEVAQRVAADCGGNRGVIERELEKYALYAEASPETPKPLDHAIIDAVGAGSEGDLSRLVDAVLGGDLKGLETELARLRAQGIEGISLLRPALLRRMALLARLRAQVEQGSSVSEVMASAGKSLFWKEKDAIGAQLRRWRAELIAKVSSRLNDAQRLVVSSGGPGPVAIDEELFAICRQAARLR